MDRSAPQNRILLTGFCRLPSIVSAPRWRRTFASEAGESLLSHGPCKNSLELTGLDAKDLVIIGGGVAGYVAAIKAGQEGLKVFICDFGQLSAVEEG